MAPITVTKIRWEIFFLIRNLNECIKSDSAIDDAALSTPDDECLELLQKKNKLKFDALHFFLHQHLKCSIYSYISSFCLLQVESLIP